VTETDGLAPDYATARARFLAAAADTGARLAHHVFPDTGPAGEELAIDVAWYGPEDAERIVMVVSGTHGVEGYAGSYCQSRWLEQTGEPELADGLALVLLHAFNPYGFAWVRRVNEDNVDINRNFADLANPPSNDGYDTLADAIAPPTWDRQTQEETDAQILELAEVWGFEAVQAAVSGGQYTRPDGLFYGGREPTRSHRIMRELVETRLAGAKQVALLDLHTGLGEWGEVEIITHEETWSADYARTVEWWGDRVASELNDSVSTELSGEWMQAAQRWLQPAQTTAGALEWGTVDSITVVQALRADNWLHCHGDPTGPDAAAIKADLRAAFAPSDPAWIATVYECFDGVLDRTLSILSTPS
jgi:hypothetical protein